MVQSHDRLVRSGSPICEQRCISLESRHVGRGSGCVRELPQVPANIELTDRAGLLSDYTRRKYELHCSDCVPVFSIFGSVMVLGYRKRNLIMGEILRYWRQSGLELFERSAFSAA